MITPEQIVERGKGSEHSHQCALMQWVAIEGRQWPDLDLLFAVPNGGARSMSVAAAIKAEGVKSGVPDLFLPVPRSHYPGLWIEMKKPGEERKANGGRSDNQVRWHKRLRRMSYAVVTCYSWKAAVNTLQRYYLGGLAMPHDGDALPVVE